MQQLIERIEIELDDIDDLDVAIVAGELSIAEGEGPFRLDAEVLEGPPLSLSSEEGRVHIRHEAAGALGLVNNRLRANVRIRVPVGTPVHAAAVSAEVLLDGLTGPVTARTVSGDLTGTALTATVDLKTVSGDVGLQRMDGALVLGTVSGDVTISDGRLETLTVRTVSGDVMADLAWPGGSTVQATTVSGNVVLRLPEGSGLQLDTSTLSGDLRCDLPLVVERADRRHLAGSVGDSSGRVVARTTSGDVTLLAR